jgi:hypothetical protein
MRYQKECSGGCVCVIFGWHNKFDGTYPVIYALIVNQIASATITTTIAPQTTDVTFFELPLRGESLGAWL